MKHQPPPPPPAAQATQTPAAQATQTPAAQATQTPAAQAIQTPAAADPDADIPTYEQLLADPEIAALLDFGPVPRRCRRDDGWTDEMQRMFIARLARHGSPGKACDELGKARSGIDKMAKKPAAKSFRKAWDRAVALAERRRAEHVAAGHTSVAGIKLPFLDNRQTSRSRARNQPAQPLPGQVRNEHGEWEDEASLQGRGAAAADSITTKLLRCRRIFLQEISDNPGKRAAFELLTDLAIDWGKAERLEPQDHEPGRIVNQHKPDMVLTAESGWSMGEIGYGPDKKAEMRAALDQYRAKEGLPAIDWGAGGDESGE